MAQNAERVKQTLQMPVLAIGGAASWGDHVGDGMRATAADGDELRRLRGRALGRRTGARGAP